MLTLIVKFEVKPEQLETFKQVLNDNKLGSVNEPGMLEMRFFEGKDSPTTIFAYERWASAEAHQAHVNQPYAKTLLQLAETALASPLEVMNLKDTAPAPLHENNPKQVQPQDEVFSIFFIFKIKQEFRAQLLQQFTSHVQCTRSKEPGNLVFDLYTIEGQGDTLVIYEHWRTESDLWDIHFYQPYAIETGKVLEQAIVGDMKQYMNFVNEF